MGYQMNDGRWADTAEVTLVEQAEHAETFTTEALELGDRGTARLTLDVVAASAVGTNETQSIAVSDATDGTFTLAFGGDTTDPIAHDAAAEDVQTALEALESIGEGNVECTGGALGTAPVAVEFVGELAGTNVDQLVADDALLVGAGAAAAVTTTQAGVPGTKTLDVAIQTSEDGVNGWAALAAFTQATGVTAQRKVFTGCDRYLRAVATIAGDTPAFTFSVHGEAV